MRKPMLFLAVAVAQLAVPLWMIRSHERVLHEGEVFRFRTAPIDPRDPFRGEYVRLEFEAESGSWPLPRPDDIELGQSLAFAILEKDGAGYASVRALVAEPPAAEPYVEVECYVYGSASVRRIRFPFDRYYLEEGDGPRTEDLLMPNWEEDTRLDPLPAYAMVRLLDGQPVLEDLIVADRPLREWLAASPEEAAVWRRAVPAVADCTAIALDTLAAPPPPVAAP